MNETILVVDDEPSIHEVVRPYLEREGFIVYAAGSGGEGIAMAQEKQPAIIVLDLMLPDMPGEKVCAEVRLTSDVAIIMLSAKSDAEERVHGLDLGADDYLTKPFSPRELVARVKALLRRAGGDGVASDHRSFDGGALRIDVPRREVVVGDRRVELTPSEFKLLVALTQHPGRAYSRFELINRVQGYDFAGYERTIDAHVKNLRKKLEPDPAHPRYVETLHGVGYRFGAPRP